jgi:hypothetical protein
MATKMTDKEKAKRKEKIKKGMPYTKEQLKSMHFTELAIILGILGVNPFKLEDKSIDGKIAAILKEQKKQKM